MSCSWNSALSNVCPRLWCLVVLVPRRVVQPLSHVRSMFDTLTPMYTVGRAAELTGISPDTLRMWQRRYAVVEPIRSDGGYRLYDDPALRRLAAMKSLVDSGWAADQMTSSLLKFCPLKIFDFAGV